MGAPWTDSNGHMGAYRWGGFTGILPAALGANSEIFQFRWTSTALLAAIREVRIAAAVSTTFFAAGVPVQIDMVKATGWTAQGTGGTGITPAATMKKKLQHPSSVLAANDMRIATTAALGAGTKTLEANSIGAVAAAGPVTASLDGTILAPYNILECDIADGDYPLILAPNEGFVLRSVAVPATGTWTLSVMIDWSEIQSY